ncbi:hypothetical protein Ddye_002760 [Dipteronia dyeriana]|uniref:CCHC-type domain-containing protein n=1 Tax=Dipteronia dyeriana TaxID=168575 RepID=A0AAD9XQW5_9ROSI|nr:hypothetical protein Ddye_002760 [Dipteronia dyeriana]
MEWMNVDLHWHIGGMMGNTYKVDPITESQARGRFARICIDLDIRKPLKSSLSMDDRIMKVEYENVGLICFNCGRIGHSKEVCKDRDMEQNKAANMPDIGKVTNATGNGSYGPWMQVSYGRNVRNNVGTKNVARKSGNVGNSGGNSYWSKEQQ